MSKPTKFRITLWDRSGTGGWRGTVKAVVFDAKSIGVEEQANDVGSAYWTLPNEHPQLAEFVPLARHYEIDRWSIDRSRWEFVAAGILNDYTVGDYETVFSGLDYKAVLEQNFTAFPGMKTDDSSALSSKIVAANFASSIFGTDALVSPTVSTSISVSGATVSAIAIASTTNTNASGNTVITSPAIDLSFDLAWSGATAAGVGFSFFIVASPPGLEDPGTPPLGTAGVISYSSVNADSGNNLTATGVKIRLLGIEAESQIPSGQRTIPDALTSTVSYASSTYNRTIMPLRTGVTYKFSIYAGRTQGGVTYVSKLRKLTAAVTLGQGQSETADTIISRVFTDATTTNSRLDYATLTTISSATATHTTYLYGKNVLTAIADVCDLQMGADTSKVVTFGIDRPSGTSDYNGKFKLDLNVASSTTLALIYPYTIKSFSYTPGYSNVRNDITVIPSGQYLSGFSSQNYGISTIGATASDTASIASYGKIPLVVTKTGFVNEEAAGKEATRLKRIYSETNTKRVAFTVVVDGVDMWYGWDLGSTVNVTIKENTLVSVSIAQNLPSGADALVSLTDAPFIISGVRWFGESDGHERIELDLVLASAFRAGRANA